MAIKSMIQDYFSQLYTNTMNRIYQDARQRIADCLSSGGFCLDCGAGTGHQYKFINKFIELPVKNYFGIEWNQQYVLQAKEKGFQIDHGDLNKNLPFKDNFFQCVFGLSVLEHLVNGCHFLKEARRILKPTGRLILITPNLSAWFNVLLLALGRIPSSGPHPDSEILLQRNKTFHFGERKKYRLEEDAPLHRHLVVFTYRTLYDYLNLLGFRKIKGRAYGYYPFPPKIQNLFEKLDPWHCHQLLFDCEL